MDISALITEIFQIVLIPLLGVLTKYFIQFVNNKAEELKQKREDALYKKYITMLNETIVNVVTATNQTYVEDLKAKGDFGPEAQKEAFKHTYDTIIQIMGEEATKYLSSAIGDLTAYITQGIERQVSDNKVPSLVEG